MRTRIAVAAVLAAAVAVAAAATPASAVAGVGGPRVASSAAGSIVVWSELDEVTRVSKLRVAEAPLGGRFGRASTLLRARGGLGAAGVAISDAGEVLATWQRTPADPPKAGGPPRPRLEAALRPPGGDFGPPIRLSDGPLDPLPSPVLTAMSASGHAGVAWSQGRRTYVALRGPRGPFAPAQEVALSRPLNLGVAGDGEALVAGIATCPDPSCPFAAASRPAGGGFGQPEMLGSESGIEPSLIVALGERGGALAVRTASAQGGLVASRRPPGAARFGGPEPLSPEGERPFPVAAGVTGAGESIAVWRRPIAAGGGLAAAHADPGAPFSSPQSIPSPAGLTRDQFDVDPDGRATAIWADDSRIRLTRRRAGEDFGPVTDVGDAIADLSELRLAATGDTATIALSQSAPSGTPSGRDTVKVATVSPAGTVRFQTLATSTPPPATPPEAKIPAGVTALAQRGGRRIRVPVACTSQGGGCRGRVTVRSGQRSWSAPYRLEGGLGRWVRVPAMRRLHRAIVEVRVSRRRTDRRVLAVRGRAMPRCPRVPWARVLERRAGVTVSSLTRADPIEGGAFTTTVSACRRQGGRQVTLRTSRDALYEDYDAVLGAWADSRTIALAVAHAPFRSASTVAVVLHDPRSGRVLGTVDVGTIDATIDQYPPAREVLDVAFTRGGDAVYAAQIGGDVRIAVLERDGDHRVIEEGPDVDPKSVRRQARSL